MSKLLLAREISNFKIVPRNGTLSYNKTILALHVKTIEITEIFHLVKNLSTYCKKTISNYLKSDIIPIHATYGTRKKVTLLDECVYEINDCVT